LYVFGLEGKGVGRMMGDRRLCKPNGDKNALCVPTGVQATTNPHLSLIRRYLSTAAVWASS